MKRGKSPVEFLGDWAAKWKIHFTGARMNGIEDVNIYIKWKENKLAIWGIILAAWICVCIPTLASFFALCGAFCRHSVYRRNSSLSHLMFCTVPGNPLKHEEQIVNRLIKHVLKINKNVTTTFKFRWWSVIKAVSSLRCMSPFWQETRVAPRKACRWKEVPLSIEPLGACAVKTS